MGGTENFHLLSVIYVAVRPGYVRMVIDVELCNVRDDDRKLAAYDLRHG